MIFPILYWLCLPFLSAWLVLRFIRKYGQRPPAEDIARLVSERPIEKKWFRTVRRGQDGLTLLGDFETHADAVDAAYLGRKNARAEGRAAAFLVLNDKAETLEEIAS